MNQNAPITLRGVKQNNLKNLDLEIPRNQLTVITGLSGSGKSTLAFETLYAEGQRRYVESLSTYTRQFLEKMPKPELDSIENIPPAIALEQRNTVLNSRSTVGTQTEMMDFLRLFFSKIGSLKCRECASTVIDITPDQLSRHLLLSGLGKKFALLSPIEFSADQKPKSSTFLQSYLSILQEQGFKRVFWIRKKTWIPLDETVSSEVPLSALLEGELYLLMDRFQFDKMKSTADLDADMKSRFTDSLEQSLKFGHEKVLFLDLQSLDSKLFQTGFACLECGTRYPKPSPNLFSFNSPLGACLTCNGFGFNLELDERKVIPSPELTLGGGCLDPLAKPSAQDEFRKFLKDAQKQGIRPTLSWSGMTSAQKKWTWRWLERHFEMLNEYKYKFHVRIFIRRYQSPKECPDCRGSRLKPEALAIEIKGKSIADLLGMPLNRLLEWFQALERSSSEKELLKELYPQILKRLEFLCRVGVPYLTLNRLTRTLSGGEFQRINLATHLGNGLCGTLYVLDEPTIGLHPEDTDRLLGILRDLREQGNTLVVVEHETKILKDADWIIELGPEAGKNGGALVVQGKPELVAKTPESRTSRFLGKNRAPPVRTHPLRTQSTGAIVLKGCSENNLKDIDATLPLQKLVVVTGVSGSGKTTLIHHTLAPAISSRLSEHGTGTEEEEHEPESTGAYKSIHGHESIRNLILLDQKPIGKNSRSNPATYLRIWDEVRKILSQQSLALSRGYTAGYFSFNVDGGRCPTCKGEGEISVDMHFLAQIKLKCEDCDGNRFIKPLLDVRFKGKSVADLLVTTIDEAHDLFFEYPDIRRKLGILREVGLGYLELGQSGPTLSGGEAQRLKIASALCEPMKGDELFILDEPTTGLHQDDVMRLLKVLHHLVDEGKSVILIEHNLDVIRNSDFVLDLGPGGGESGGEIIASGPPEALMKIKASKTGAALREF
ncbi:MAG: excinuclease ABC subunit UvrA [Bdellovibrionales bacterium]|nr:excinuclease ABC subunit UvrA [Bdellovibrionales bacterium]